MNGCSDAQTSDRRGGRGCARGLIFTSDGVNGRTRSLRTLVRERPEKEPVS